MGKTWIPDPQKPIDKNERVGRRIWDTPQLRGVDDQPVVGAVDIENFREKRDREVSLDRLGRSSIEKKVVNYLRPRCEAHGSAFNPERSFDGWATIKAENLTNKWNSIPKWNVFPSPVKEETVPHSGNRYHAHAVCEGDDNDLTTALFLRHLFERYGELQPIDACNAFTDNTPSWLLRLWRFLGARIRRQFDRSA